MKSAYTNTHTKAINRRPTKLQKLAKRLLILGVIGIVCAAAYTVVKSVDSLDTASTDVQFPYGSIQELSDTETFMAAYLSVNCKTDLLRSTQTFRAVGTIESGGDSLSFTLIKKRPDKMRFTIKRSSQEIIYGVNADTVWQCIRAPQQEDQFARIEGEEATKWVPQARFFDWIISASQGKGEIVGIEVEQWTGNDSLKVRVIDDYGNTYAIFIDPQTLYPIAERLTLPNGKITETVFNDYRDVDGLPTPFQLTISVESKSVSKIQLNNATLNAGILSHLFELPNALQ
jgi:outer membrane lipoprotein-sorting protein